MPAVKTQKKSSRGVRVCGRIGCGREIQPGETYYIFAFRYGGKHFRCSEHYPKPSELTQSKMSGVYAAQEQAHEDLGTLDEIKAAVQQLAESVREVVEEYREAAEHFGGQGENAERADELEGWADELEQWEPEEDNEEFDEDEHRDEALELVTDEDMTYTEAMQKLRDDWEEEHGDESEEALEAIRDQAREIIDSCPL